MPFLDYINPGSNQFPGGSRALTWFNSHPQLWVVVFLSTAQRASELRFSRQVHPFLWVNEQPFAQQLHRTLVLDLGGNLGRSLSLREGVFQLRDLGHPPGHRRPGHRRSPAPCGAWSAGRGGAGRGCGPGLQGRGPQAPDPRGGVEKESLAQVQLRSLREPGGLRRDCLTPPVCGPDWCTTPNWHPHLRPSRQSNGVPFSISPSPSFLSLSLSWAQGHFSYQKLPGKKKKKKNRKRSSVFSGGRADVRVPTLRKHKRLAAWQPWEWAPGRKRRTPEQHSVLHNLGRAYLFPDNPRGWWGLSSETWEQIPSHHMCPNCPAHRCTGTQNPTLHFLRDSSLELYCKPRPIMLSWNIRKRKHPWTWI